MTDDDTHNLSRHDFLRGVTFGAAGFGLATLASCARSEVADAAPRKGYVVAVTHGPEDPNRVMLALFTATRLPAGDNHVWFAIDGGQLCKKGEAEKVTSPLFQKQDSAAALLLKLREKGTANHI